MLQIASRYNGIDLLEIIISVLLLTGVGVGRHLSLNRLYFRRPGCPCEDL